MSEQAPTIIHNLKKLYGHFTTRRRYQLVMLMGLMLIGAVAEMVSIGMVVPFLTVFVDPTQSTCDIFFVPCGLTLTTASLLFAATVAVAATIRLVLNWASLRFTFGLGGDISNEVYRRTLYQPYSFHVARNTSEIIGGINKSAGVVGIINALTQALVALFIGVSIVGTLYIVDPQVTSIAILGFGLLYGVTVTVTRKRLQANSKIIARTENQRIQAVQEGLGGIRDVLLDGTQGVYVHSFQRFNYRRLIAQAKNAFMGTSPRYVIEAVGVMMIIGLAWVLQQREGGLTAALPVLGALALGAQRLLPLMQQLYFAWSGIKGSQATLEDVILLLEQPIPEEYLTGTVQKKLDLGSYTKHPEPNQTTTVHNLSENSPHPREEGQGEGSEQKDHKSSHQPDLGHAPLAIRLENVSFRYHQDAVEVLKNVNFHIPIGKTVGFIGKTGSGKSTLIDLIMGLLEPTSGEINIAGEKLTKQNRRNWQSNIAHVPQAIFLADTTIAENVALGYEASKIDMDRVQASLEKAQLADFIETLPQNYKTPVGERGVRLSGGQRQRIGLARAFYKQAHILVLDEATSALDNETETAVMNEIHRFGDEVTVLMIAHRLSTLRNCDRIIELEKGEIVREGSYQDVIGGLGSQMQDVGLSQ